MVQFLKDLFRIPGPNGERRLVMNYFTGEMVWTKGVEPSPVKTTGEDFFKVKPVNTEKAKPNERSGLIHLTNTIAYEPLRNDRFIVNFSDVEPHFIQSYHFLGEEGKTQNSTRYSSAITTVLPLSPVLALEDKLLSMKGKNIGSVTIDLVDATGEVIRKIVLDNVVVDEVDLLDGLDYENDEIAKAQVYVSHDKRKIVNPFDSKTFTPK